SGRRPQPAQVFVDGRGIVSHAAAQVERLVRPARHAARAHGETVQDTLGGEQAGGQERPVLHALIVTDGSAFDAASQTRGSAVSRLTFQPEFWLLPLPRAG